MSFGDLYTVQPGQGNPPGLPAVDLPRVDPPPRPRTRVEIYPDRPRDEGGAYGFVKGAPPVAPTVSTPAQDEDQSGFVKGAPPLPQDTAPPRNVPAGEAIARGAVSGMTFGASPAMAGVQAAGLDWLPPDIQNLFAGHEHEPTVGAFLLGLARLGYEKFTGGQGGAEAYRKRRDEVRKAEEEAQKQRPAAFLAGEIPAALAMPLGAGAGATRLGRVAASAGAGALGGGLNESGAALSRGESPIDIAKAGGKGALTGAGFGLVGGGAVEAAGALGSRAMSIMRGTRNVDDEAARRVLGALRSDYERAGLPIGPAEGTAGRAAGTPTALVDWGGERTRALARSSANTSPEARQVLTELTQNRFEQQSPRIGGFIRRMTGGGDAFGDLEAIQAAARRSNRGNYARAYAAGDRPIGAGPRMQELMSAPVIQHAMRDAVERGQNRAVADGFGAFNAGATVTPDGRLLFRRGPNGVPIYPNLQYWDYVQRELRDAAGAAGRAGRNEEAGAISALHRQLREELDRMVPQFGQARRGAAAFFGAEDALEAGRNFVMQNASIPEARRAIARMSPPERELFARGFASDLADKIEATRDRINVINSVFLGSGAARQKIELALGPQRSRQLEALLRVEGVIDQARTALGNSSTVRQMAEAGMAGAGAVGAFEALKEHDFNPVHLVTAALTFGAIRHGAHVIDERTARRVGEMLASNDTDILRRGIQVVASTPAYFEALRRATAAGVRLGERHIGPDNAAAGVAAGALRLIEGPPEKPHELHPADYYGNPQ